MVRRFFPAVGAMLALAWIGASVYAQTSVDLSSTGFKGEVKQIQQGGVGIGGATVQYTGPTVTDSVVTDAAGNFEVVNIEPGPYVLSITAEGYKPRESQTVTVVQDRKSVV